MRLTNEIGIVVLFLFVWVFFVCFVFAFVFATVTLQGGRRPCVEDVYSWTGHSQLFVPSWERHDVGDGVGLCGLQWRW